MCVWRARSLATGGQYASRPARCAAGVPHRTATTRRDGGLDREIQVEEGGAGGGGSFTGERGIVWRLEQPAQQHAAGNRRQQQEQQQHLEQENNARETAQYEPWTSGVPRARPNVHSRASFVLRKWPKTLPWAPKGHPKRSPSRSGRSPLHLALKGGLTLPMSGRAPVSSGVSSTRAHPLSPRPAWCINEEVGHTASPDARGASRAVPVAVRGVASSPRARRRAALCATAPRAVAPGGSPTRAFPLSTLTRQFRAGEVSHTASLGA